MDSIKTGAFVLCLSVVSFACSANGPEGDGAEVGSARDAALTAELEGKFNAYAQALADRNTELLRTLVSSEIQLRIGETGMDMAGFAEKLRGSMLNQFNGTSVAPESGSAFQITSLRVEGEAVRVEVSSNGETLAKPFYFVKEDGDYRLNLVRQGFTRAQPEGSGAATDTYRIKNDNAYPQTGRCSGSQGLMPAVTELAVRCENKCGFFHGTRFYSPFSNDSIKCDYNTWGVDAIYNDRFGSLGVICNDKC